MRRVMSTLLLLSLGFLILASLVPASSTRASARLSYWMVDITDIGPERLSQAKSYAIERWWVEAGDRLLLLGPDTQARALRARGFSCERLPIDSRPELLIIHMDDQSSYIADAELILRDGRLSLLQKSAVDSYVDPGEGLLKPFRAPMTFSQSMTNHPLRVLPDFPEASATAADSINADRWFDNTRHLATMNRGTSNAGNKSAREWIKTQFAAIPGLVVSEQSFTVNSTTTAYNIIARYTGQSRKDDLVLVGGHYDSTGFGGAPGAEDNASGTAGVLELARALVPLQPEASMIFVAFGAEEQGLVGSRELLRQMKSNGETTSITHYINMDMIGYNGDQQIDAMLETSSKFPALQDDLAAAAKEFTELKIYRTFHYWGSDHVPFIDAGVPGILTIENENEDYPHYHTAKDTIENVDKLQGSELLRMNAAALARWAM
jgi:hypothetical protein